MSAIGLVEISGLVAAIDAVDAMLKVADVKFVTWEKTLGGRLVTIIIEGSISAVKEAVSVGVESGNKVGKTVAHVVIPNPHQEVIKMAEISAMKLNMKEV
ncbi:MAG: hypothetical protein PWP27_1494 [Clostridiales bacterium]|jgi:microcompartment protein CcmL/EutN|nr:hypothetical protein [Clostridiales bacterium]MDK2933684.1 hypothetical protein [Clostridiales bacterium]